MNNMPFERILCECEWLVEWGEMLLREPTRRECSPAPEEFEAVVARLVQRGLYLCVAMEEALQARYPRFTTPLAMIRAEKKIIFYSKLHHIELSARFHEVIPFMNEALIAAYALLARYPEVYEAFLVCRDGWRQAMISQHFELAIAIANDSAKECQ